MEEDKPIRIDVKDAIQSKAPRYARYIPEFIYRKIARIVRQDDLNRILMENHGKNGTDFAEGALRSLDIKLQIKGEENLLQKGRLIFASNHPLGGLDGIALISLIGKRYGGNVKFVVNDILMAVKPLESVFLPINKHGAQTKSNIRQIDDAFDSDCQMIMFPAGLCSRRNQKGEVCDLEWQKSFIAKSISSRRDVVPIYFEGENSSFFYKFAAFRKRIGIKLNIEMVCLPGEMIKSAGRTYTVYVGERIPYTLFDGSRSKQEWAQYVKERVYALKKNR